MEAQELLAWARGNYARSNTPQDRQYYRGAIEIVTGEFDASRCDWRRDPLNVPEYCYGARDARGLLEPPAGMGRAQHGGPR